MTARSVLFAATACLVLQAGGAVAQPMSAYGFDPVLADYQQVPVGASRQVVASRLEVRTRPIPEAAVLDVLDAGDLVGVVSEGGGWATMDLGGGFLGWMRADGLGPVTRRPEAAPRPKVAPVPAERSRRPAPPSVPEAVPTGATVVMHAGAYQPRTPTPSPEATAPASPPARRF